MKTKIVFDVDEVIRDLGTLIHKRFKIPQYLQGVWWDSYKGLNFYDWMAKDLSILVDAPTTEYYKTIKSLNNGSVIEFWSHQPKEWQANTIIWLSDHFGDNFKVRFLDREEKYKELKKQPNTLLVEDSPFFPSYKQIILLDKSYNKLCKAKIRIKTPKELKELLENIK
jgi:hypothetical protein